VPLSMSPAKLTGQREAPAWQFVVDNSPSENPSPAAGGDDWWAGAVLFPLCQPHPLSNHCAAGGDGWWAGAVLGSDMIVHLRLML